MKILLNFVDFIDWFELVLAIWSWKTQISRVRNRVILLFRELSPFKAMFYINLSFLARIRIWSCWFFQMKFPSFPHLSIFFTWNFSVLKSIHCPWFGHKYTVNLTRAMLIHFRQKQERIMPDYPLDWIIFRSNRRSNIVQSHLGSE